MPLSQGPLDVSAGANIAGAGADWTTPGNIAGQDLTYAAVNTGAGATSDALAATDCGFGIPGGANIVGIVVEFFELTDGTI